MSVKLPLIIKRDSQPGTPVKPKQKETIDLSNEGLHLAQEEEDYEGDGDFQQEREELKEPVDIITVLKAPTVTQSRLTVQLLSKEDIQSQKATSRIKELSQILAERINTTNELKGRINEQKKQIKLIGEKVDKDLNKSLLKASKSNTVNIRDIFAAAPKTNNQKLNGLNQQLKKIRMQIRKNKGDINKMQNSLNDPVIVMNEQKGVQFKSRIRTTDQGIKTIEHQKALLEEELSRGEKQFNEEEEKQKEEDVLRLTTQLAEIQNAQKEEKLKIYYIEKEDIVLMEKAKYFQQREGFVGAKKQKASEKSKQKLQQQIKSVISEINEAIEQRNKAQIERKQHKVNLAAQVSSLETKNWELCNKLRQIDAFLLQYYERKTRRKEVKPLEKTIDVMEKSVSGKVESQTVVAESLQKYKKSAPNDKNVQSPIVMIEKKKNYEFGLKQNFQGEINLSDECLGPKLIIKSISIKCSDSKVVQLHTTYTNSFGNQIDGFVMGTKTYPEHCQQLQLVLQTAEVINFVHTGLNDKNNLAFLHLVTSEGKELKWGTLQHIIKSQQKHIKRYQSSFLKAKIITETQQNSLKLLTSLAGITLITTYMGPK